MQEKKLSRMKELILLLNRASPRLLSGCAGDNVRS